jgi:hypothetical protein
VGQEADICKGGKAGHKCPKCGTRHQSVRQYVNRNKPIISPPPEWLPGPDDGDEDMTAMPDMGKSTVGNPVPPAGGQGYNQARVSPPVKAGHQAASSGDHGAAAGERDPMNQPGPKALALGHESMRQGSTTAAPWSTMRQRIADEYGDRSITRGPAGLVGLSMLDAAGAAGSYQGMNPVSANPVTRPVDHSARNSATPPNGSHGLADAQSHAVALKGLSDLEIMKRTQRPMYGGNR